jgi:hypothetical protein
MGRRYRRRRRYGRSIRYTKSIAQDELKMAVIAGIFLIPFTFGLSLIVILFVALKGAFLAKP